MKADNASTNLMSGNSPKQALNDDEDEDEDIADSPVYDFTLNLKVQVVLVASINASNLLVWFYTALKYMNEMFSVHQWSHPIMFGVKIMYTLSFVAANTFPHE